MHHDWDTWFRDLLSLIFILLFIISHPWHLWQAPYIQSPKVWSCKIYLNCKCFFERMYFFPQMIWFHIVALCPMKSHPGTYVIKCLVGHLLMCRDDSAGFYWTSSDHYKTCISLFLFILYFYLYYLFISHRPSKQPLLLEIQGSPTTWQMEWSQRLTCQCASTWPQTVKMVQPPSW